jgi:vacuolar-type H+-ATPase subunit I/STV1
LYAEDVAASSELKVRDEAGNISTLSPHNFSLLPNGPAEQLSWAYYSEHAPSGTAINVDMLEVVREVEKLSGKNLVYKAITEDKKEDGSYAKITEVEKISNSLVQQVSVQTEQIKELQKQNEELIELLEELLDKKSE